VIVKFPAVAVLVTSSTDGWCVLTPRGLKWLHIDRGSAQRHGRWLSERYELPLRVLIGSTTTRTTTEGGW
jgi:hypothetical protein